jgi:hypothetical protein
VFQPFVRLDPERTKGSGIGLTIVRRIIDLYEGEIGIQSEPGAGCTVTFSLPVLGKFPAAEKDGLSDARVADADPSDAVILAKTSPVLPGSMAVPTWMDEAKDAELKQKSRTSEGGHYGDFNG